MQMKKLIKWFKSIFEPNKVVSPELEKHVEERIQQVKKKKKRPKSKLNIKE